MQDISIFCFAASYSVALLLEVSRLAFRSGVRGAAMLTFGAAGLVAHSLFLINKAMTADGSGSPLSDKQDWYLLAAWGLAAVYLCLTFYYPKAPFGLFLLPLVLGLIVAGTLCDDSKAFSRESTSMAWGIIHGVSILAGTVAVSVGFAAGLMYLGQNRRLKNKRPPAQGMQLPSLEWLAKANSRAMTVAAWTWGVGVASGMVLITIGARSRGEPIEWLEPAVLSTQVMFVWLLVSKLACIFHRASRQGRTVAYMAIVSFLLLLVTLGVSLFSERQHGGGDAEVTRSAGAAYQERCRVGTAHQESREMQQFHGGHCPSYGVEKPVRWPCEAVEKASFLHGDGPAAPSYGSLALPTPGGSA